MPKKFIAFLALNYVINSYQWRIDQSHDYCAPGGWGGYFLVIVLWGCAAGRGHIFTTGLTTMGLHFQSHLSIAE